MKKGKFLLFVFILMFCFSFSSSAVFASEVETTTIQEEEKPITYQDQLNDFWNKWFGVIFATVGGASGTTAIILVFLRKIKKKIENHEQLTEEDYQEAKRLLTSAKQYVQASQELIDVASKHEEITSDFVNEYNGLIESYKKTFDIQTGEIDLLLTHISVLKDLMCKLVASNPELASNGYATEIIKICDETLLTKRIKRVKIMSKKQLRFWKYFFGLLSYILLFLPLFIICIVYRHEFFTKNVGGFTVGLGGILAVIYIVILIKIGFQKINPIISTAVLVVVMYCLQTILNRGFILSIGLFAGVVAFEVLQLPYKHFSKLVEAWITEEVRENVRAKKDRKIRVINSAEDLDDGGRC